MHQIYSSFFLPIFSSLSDTNPAFSASRPKKSFPKVHLSRRHLDIYRIQLQPAFGHNTSEISFDLPISHTPSYNLRTLRKRIYPNMASGKAARVQLSDDEVDDILYLTRTNESAELQQYLTQLSQQHNCSIAALLESTVDEDNANTPFHYCAANGYAGTTDIRNNSEKRIHTNILAQIFSKHSHHNSTPQRKQKS